MHYAYKNDMDRDLISEDFTTEVLLNPKAVRFARQAFSVKNPKSKDAHAYMVEVASADRVRDWGIDIDDDYKHLELYVDGCKADDGSNTRLGFTKFAGKCTRYMHDRENIGHYSADNFRWSRDRRTGEWTLLVDVHFWMKYT